MNPRSSAGHSNLYNYYYYYETTHPPKMSSNAHPVLTHSYPQESWDTSKRRVHSSYLPPPTPGHCFTMSSTPLPAVNASNRVHNTLVGSHKPIHRNSMCIDEGGFDCVETTKDTSKRHVPPLLPAVDVSKHVHNMFDGSHKPMHRKLRCLNEVGVDDDENTKAMSVRRVPTPPTTRCVESRRVSMARTLITLGTPRTRP